MTCPNMNKLSHDEECIKWEVLCIKPSPLQPANKTMRLMKDRLDTFMNWSASHIVTPQESAEAGFYNTYRDDQVQCAFCLGALHNWKRGDTAIMLRVSDRHLIKTQSLSGFNMSEQD